MSSSTGIVTTPSGDLQGVVRPDGTTEFLGIRYATSERFLPPQDALTWEGLLQASSYGPLAPQTPGMLEQMLGLSIDDMSEDCHFLNVFAPTEVTAGANLPVLFWIHGGAYLNGAGSLTWYHGSRLASRNAIVVSINYRLGALGFLGDGNMGTLDMISALRWTQRNIAAFGGDPGNVTIFGESAGGSAVISLLASEAASTLFHKVWSMSPSIGQLRSKNRGVEVAQQFFEAAGINSLEEAKNLTLEQVLSAQATVIALPSDSYDVFAPCEQGSGIEGQIMPKAALSPKPLVVGTNRDENKLFSAFDPTQANISNDKWLAFTQRIFETKAAQAAATYEKFRPGESPAQLISAVNTDIAFRRRAQLFAEQRCANDNPTWMYWFTWPTPVFGGVLGSCHALDIPFAFDNLGAPGTELLTGDGPERQALADRFASEIVQFAQHGHPSWEQFNTDSRPTLRLDMEISLIHDPEPQIRQLYS
jgi:para-nitrobenzyl esterase